MCMEAQGATHLKSQLLSGRHGACMTEKAVGVLGRCQSQHCVKQAARGKKQRSFFRSFEFGIKQLGSAHDGIGFCMV